MIELSEVATAEAMVPGEFVSFPGSPFQLFQPYAPAGDQPQAIAELVAGIGDGLSFQTLLGVTGSGKTFTMANVIARLRPARRSCSRRTRHWRRSCTASSASSSRRTRSSTSSATTTTSSPRPMCRSATCSSRRTRSINEHIEQMRLSATKSLLERRDVIIVASVSCIYGIGSPQDYHKMVMTLRVGDGRRPARRASRS